ncbi:MAG: multiple sugar transport system permease protein [Thermosipho sp. (in: thermotogales)]|nr:multiple sugar transport system permease protein [Thermosipho sp. (in: thermotogales)]MDN5325098.1 multiple sugar transport system permease protein [Thermosipho sp. (in: thermotogales)]
MTKKKTVPYVLIIPLLIAFGIFMFYPLYKVIENSFYESSFLNPFKRQFVGFENYKWLFNFKLFNPKWSYFMSAFGRSLLWVGLSVTLKIIIGLGGSLLLNSKHLSGSKIYRILIVVPWAIPWAMGAMMWAWTLNGQFGIVNSFLLKLHIIKSPISFFSTPLTAFISTILVDVWAGLPFVLIMLLSGLQNIPEVLYEAATIDGAGDFTKFTKITLPTLKPVILTVSLLSLVWTFNSFDIIWILTRGGPLNSTETLPIAIYNVSFLMTRFGGIGKASAMTIAQVLLVTIVSIFYIKILGKGAEG